MLLELVPRLHVRIKEYKTPRGETRPGVECAEKGGAGAERQLQLRKGKKSKPGLPCCCGAKGTERARARENRVFCCLEPERFRNRSHRGELELGRGGVSVVVCVRLARTRSLLPVTSKMAPSSYQPDPSLRYYYSQFSIHLLTM